MKVGVTGHQRLENPAAWVWVETAINGELDRLDTPLIGLTSLAIGADQLFARLIVLRGGEIHATIPFPDYERTFDAESVTAYRALLLKAASVEVLRQQDTDQDAYMAAGKHIVAQADLMVAVWNGLPAKGKGGTADIVSYAVAKHVPMIHINPVDRTITRR